ncbi:transcriptional regulator FtrA [Kiloniella litopenaei]|uniref:transcriptional regulator FtrA n=1 Tax=Kiloniella litopenaei TaxID=1549748 RepID=UPI001C3F52F3|nr:transcriptional regulator FtrA [Kiloniella litopenaei]
MNKKSRQKLVPQSVQKTISKKNLETSQEIAVKKANHLVAAVVYDGLCTFEYGMVVEAFGLDRPEFDDWYDFTTCSADSGPCRAIGGLQVTAEKGLEVLEKADTIVVPGWRSVHERPPEALLEAIWAAYYRGARIVSICSGVFVLAAAGILRNQKVTTHWRYADLLAETYPDLHVDPNVLFIDEGRIMTSAGSAAGLDLCLNIIRNDFGPAVANKVAKRLVLPAQRDGGQAQFIDRPQVRRELAMDDLLAWIRKHLHTPLRVEELARRAHMSLRTFIRRFKEATGLPPAKWMIQERLALACTCLEETAMSVEEIASHCGFGLADTLRHHFRDQMGISPTRYRQNYQIL